MTSVVVTSDNPSFGFNINSLAHLDISSAGLRSLSNTKIAIQVGDNPADGVTFTGSGFLLHANDIDKVVVSGMDFQLSPVGFSLQGFAPIHLGEFADWAADGNIKAIAGAFFGGDDSFIGSAGADILEGYTGNDTVFAGGGTDLVDGDDGRDYLRGDDGSDTLSGGADFDDINGNKGNDVAFGGSGGDWVAGGQDNDLLFGEGGDDVVYGNLGSDTLSGGDGDDWLRGGQANDLIDGGAGADLIWGDRGDDTITGGSGADQFHTFAGSGVDRITDFNYAEGDRVIIDDHTAYTLTQSGADAVVTLAGGDSLILVGVTATALPEGWITVA